MPYVKTQRADRGKCPILHGIPVGQSALLRMFQTDYFLRMVILAH